MKKTLLLLVSTIIMFFVTSVASAEEMCTSITPQQKLAIQEGLKIKEEITQYLIKQDNGYYIYNYEKIENSNLSDNTLDQIDMFLELNNSFIEKDSNGTSNRKFPMIWGRYCGKGNLGG